MATQYLTRPIIKWTSGLKQKTFLPRKLWKLDYSSCRNLWNILLRHLRYKLFQHFSCCNLYHLYITSLLYRLQWMITIQVKWSEFAKYTIFNLCNTGSSEHDISSACKELHTNYKKRNIKLVQFWYITLPLLSYITFYLFNNKVSSWNCSLNFCWIL